ncbi:thermonuclease family protein [Paracoccus aminophilus]|uniref:Succinoglycan biosynthesis protein ExoI n=1 Tax=Paracoccus aminophilus JCM 7686 TaxID=1367847 RepID=S5YWU5_PARAH|nr:thermonuclease family protein [Paracoccus aminophilus]AGT09681.1 succinoglycan biosynthesis protein ExoI [Paracoccus aminophilus JCM 7686]
MDRNEQKTVRSGFGSVKSHHLACLLSLALATGCSPPAETIKDAQSAPAGRAIAVDGDTLRLGAERIRIHGIDAPERDQSCASANGGSWPCGKAAEEALQRMVKDGDVSCRPVVIDRYQRVVARCTVNGKDLGQMMVRQGYAWAFVRYSSEYASDEAAARRERRAIWQSPTQPAWEYRSDRRAQAVHQAPENCAIKGNISRSGQRIYHTPQSRDYAKTHISEAKGERWFCDEASAVAAGWRRAR